MNAVESRRPMTNWARRSAAEKINQQFRDANRFFVLEPVRGVGKGEELRVGAVPQTLVSHFCQQEIVAFAPEDARGNVDGAIRKLGAKTKQRAIPVDHCRE